ncbi:MAG: hypothetical protein M3N18_06310 [Actinomycetota bacterium]|nr:hypothetical protein [Actinomycetota bacterium]
MEIRKGYATVYWGKMPINFRPRAFPQEEVEGAVGYAERSFPDVLDLVPDFSVLTLAKSPEGDNTKAVLMLGDEREARVFPARRARRREPPGATVGDLPKHPVAQ